MTARSSHGRHRFGSGRDLLRDADPCDHLGRDRPHGLDSQSRLRRHACPAPGTRSGRFRVLSAAGRRKLRDTNRQATRYEMSGPKAYDLVVIGTGTAAQVASSRVREAGWSVAVIDHLPFGGTCALRGCDPKKMLISGAEAVDWVRRMRGRGVVGDLKINWRDLIAFKRTFTDPVPANHERRYAERGIDAYHGTARFGGPSTVE